MGRITRFKLWRLVYYNTKHKDTPTARLSRTQGMKKKTFTRFKRFIGFMTNSG